MFVRSGATFQEREFLMKRKNTAFTLVELLVVIGIIALLISILLPSLTKAQQAAKNVACLSNLRNIGNAIMMYTAAHKGLMPVASETPHVNMYHGWRLTPLILRDLGYLPVTGYKGGVWHCPLDTREPDPNFYAYYHFMGGGPGLPGVTVDADFIASLNTSSYAANAVYRLWSPRAPFSGWVHGGGFSSKPLSKIRQSSEKVLVYDTGYGWEVSSNDPYQLHYTFTTLLIFPGRQNHFRHMPKEFGPSANILFADGHAGGPIKLLDTIMTSGNVNDPALALRWWSISGE